MIFLDRHGTPVAIDTKSASRIEVKRIESLLEKHTLQKRQPERLVYDKAVDSDPLRKRLMKNDLICPHRKSRVKPPTQDGRKLSRFKQRWIVERSIASLHNYRRIVTRWEYHDYLYESFLVLGCLFTLLKRF